MDSVQIDIAPPYDGLGNEDPDSGFIATFSVQANGAMVVRVIGGSVDERIMSFPGQCANMRGAGGLGTEGWRAPFEAALLSVAFDGWSCLGRRLRHV